MTRTTRTLAITLAALMLAAVGLTGCSQSSTVTSDQPHSGTETPISVKIGTLPTEDSLPLWVAQDRGYFAVEGIPKVEIVEFQSAQERDAAFASGAIDAYMGDIIAAADLQAAGKGNKIATVMLGADQSQGRFGIAVAPKSTITALPQLANVPVGTSSATIQEYVLDGLMSEAGVASDSVKVEEVKKVPVRFQLLMSGGLKAAALPEPFLSLAEQGGAKIIADDTKAKANLSQTVLVFSDSFLAKKGGTATKDAVLKAWDVAANDINKDPNAYRAELVTKAKLPKSLAASYQVNTYPMHQLPAKADVDAVLAWMKSKGYLKSDVTYEQLTVTK
ncbi:MAG: MetQ/NlpA family ABC transporter substrate-binding protein [Coriobacteriia bacterium]|nr:MetQ/NlpA family ABC transporter substrate-binding protein [Coriobacteriia bacterium]